MGAGLICSGYIFILGSLHLELVHGFLSLGNIDPVVIGIAHLDSLLFIISGKQDTFRIGEHLFLSVVIVLPAREFI